MKTTRKQRVRQGLLLMSLLCFPITLNYFSPALSLAGALEGVVSGSLLVFGVIFVYSLFLGRASCGWACPIAGMQEACARVTARRSPNRANWLRYAIWVLWFGTVAVGLLSYGSAPDLQVLYHNERVYSLAEPINYTVLYSLYALVLALVFTVGNRSFCHHLCWISPFMVVARALRNLAPWPALRLRAETERCVSCGKCTAACPQSLTVQAMVEAGRVEHRECILCGQCADACPKGVIRFSFSAGIR